MGIQRYKILAICFLFIAGCFLVLYCIYYNDYPVIANILLGGSTGLFSGIILLFVTGLKSKDRGNLEERLKAICKINALIVEINQLADELTVKTYKGKADRMPIGEYSLLLERYINWGYDSTCLNSILRKILDALEQYEDNSGWFDRNNRKLIRQKVELIKKDINCISDSFDRINDFIDRYELCNPSATFSPELIQAARAELDNIALMCRKCFKLYHAEYRLEERIRAEITRIDRSII